MFARASPPDSAEAVIRSILSLPGAPAVQPDERRYLIEKLYDRYFSFETLTNHNWDAGVCGICGLCPLFESGDGNCKNCTPLRPGTVGLPHPQRYMSLICMPSFQVTWPSITDATKTGGKVDIEEWWEYVESKVVEASVYRSSSRLNPVDATKIAPWIPPSCRNTAIYNTEYLKGSKAAKSKKPTGCPKKLGDLIRCGAYNPLNLQHTPVDELKVIAAEVGLHASHTKV